MQVIANLPLFTALPAQIPSPSTRPAHPPAQNFLGLRSLLFSSSPTEAYPTIQHRSTPLERSADWIIILHSFCSSIIIASHLPSSSSSSSILHLSGCPLEIKCHCFRNSDLQSLDRPTSNCQPKTPDSTGTLPPLTIWKSDVDPIRPPFAKSFWLDAALVNKPCAWL